MNGGETDVDCGGSTCQPCADGDTCRSGDDCESLVCERGRCLVPNCMDGVQNGFESATDCGGGGCPLCGGGAMCTSDDQCLSWRCRAGVCATSLCDDGALNMDETDVDCGGPACRACAARPHCVVDEDCELQHDRHTRRPTEAQHGRSTSTTRPSVSPSKSSPSSTEAAPMRSTYRKEEELARARAPRAACWMATPASGSLFGRGAFLGTNEITLYEVSIAVGDPSQIRCSLRGLLGTAAQVERALVRGEDILADGTILVMAG